LGLAFSVPLFFVGDTCLETLGGGGSIEELELGTAAVSFSFVLSCRLRAVGRGGGGGPIKPDTAADRVTRTGVCKNALVGGADDGTSLSDGSAEVSSFYCMISNILAILGQ
jgi:hypothetical protein